MKYILFEEDIIMSDENIKKEQERTNITAGAEELSME
jgi:hypothetical protein